MVGKAGLARRDNAVLVRKDAILMVVECTTNRRLRSTELEQRKCRSQVGVILCNAFDKKLTIRHDVIVVICVPLSFPTSIVASATTRYPHLHAWLAHQDVRLIVDPLPNATTPNCHARHKNHDSGAPQTELQRISRCLLMPGCCSPSGAKTASRSRFAG